MHKIQSEHWRLWSDPAMGVQWCAAQIRHDTRWIDVVPDCRPVGSGSGQMRAGQVKSAPLAAANFHMIPYSNRIRDGQFNFAGTTIQLDNASSHAIHGALRKQAWHVKEAAPDRLVCELDTQDIKQVNWPWPMRSTIEQSIDDDVLQTTISITNCGDTSMPVGTGWHPYFVRNINGEPPVLTLPVDSVFPDANGDCLPDGAAVKLPAELDFRTPRVLPETQRIDCCMANLAGACHIHWRKAGIELIMQADDACRFLVLYNPDMPHFAVEPVSNANDAFNLDTQGIDAGTRILGAGETFSVSMSLRAVIHTV